MVIKKLFIFLMLLASALFSLTSKEYKVAIIQLPVTESFVDLFKALGEATNNTFDIQIVSPPRAINFIENGTVDIMFPSTVGLDPKKNTLLKYDYSNTKTFKMVFVLYMNKDKIFNPNDLKNNKSKNLKVESTATLISVFDFQPDITTSIDGSLKRVDVGSIDGLVYAQDSCDPILKNLDLKNIIRRLYSLNDICFALKKGTAGGEIDKMLKKGIDKLKANGKYNEILADSIKNSVYNDWQP